MRDLLSWDLLEKAADVMEKKGWNGGARHGYDGTVCVLGALEDALGVQRPYTYSYSNVVDEHPILPLLVKEIGLDKSIEPAFALARWSNNADGPTVVGYLRKLARRLHNASTM